jgi:XTP/dITP diphosphohydrolase
MEKHKESFARLLKIMDELREQCPWDQKQTIDSLRYLTIEEMYELSESIMDKDMNGIKKELGDILLHIVFYAKIASETNTFDISDVINSLCDKMIERHPHIYSNVKVNDAEDVKRNWEQIKLKTGNKSVLEGVPKGLPALVKSMRIQEKARGVGFDWEHKEQVWEKVNEELQEFKTEVENNPDNADKLEDEFGDVMFALINYARFNNINPEDALERTNKKFIKRFQYMEQKITEQGKQLSDCKLEEMDKYWNEAKKL